MALPEFIGKLAVIPATVTYVPEPSALTLDLTNLRGLRFKVDGTEFMVSHDGMAALLEAYAERMRMVAEAARQLS